MSLIKVNELEGVELDYWVAKGLGLEAIPCTCDHNVLRVKNQHGGYEHFTPATDWVDCGALIETHKIEITPWDKGCWNALIYAHFKGPCIGQALGLTPQVAACRAFVHAKFGREFESEKVKP